MGESKIRFFPHDRLHTQFAWQIWLAAWLGVLNAVDWLFWDPDHFDDSMIGLIRILFLLKFVVFSVLYAVFANALLNLRGWARKGLLLISGLDIMFNLVLIYAASVQIPFMRLLNEGDVDGHTTLVDYVSSIFSTYFFSPIGYLINAAVIIFLLYSVKDPFSKPNA